MIVVREAIDEDVDAIREIFLACYGKAYAYPSYYDVHGLRRMIYNEDTLLLVAEDTELQRVLGTASVVLDISAFNDLVGEFGRLAVHPDGRGRGIGGQLMAGRLQRVRNRIHVGLVENRIAHSYSQRISHRYGFHPLGFIPMKLLVERREHVALYGRYFGGALGLRRNHPHVIPEVRPLASMALESIGLTGDCIVDDSSAPFPHDEDFRTDSLTATGYASLLRIERGRVRQRDIFGPLRLHYGLFKLQAKQSQYLLAKRNGQIAGAIGFTIDPIEKTARVFELISLGDEPIRFLLRQMLEKCRDEEGVEYIEADINADSPRMQRTMLELDFLPAAYVPAMVFHEVERLDAVKMVRLIKPLEKGSPQLSAEMRPWADWVFRQLEAHSVQPRIAAATADIPLFAGLNREQVRRLAKSAQLLSFPAGQCIFKTGDPGSRLHVLLEGQVEIRTAVDGPRVGVLGRGQCLGENVLLQHPGPAMHSATAVALTPAQSAVFDAQATEQLVRQRPDIAVVLYRNLASGIARKLEEADRRISSEEAR